jgi:hypothetical protein
MITIGPSPDCDAEIPGLEATNLERLVELLLALPTVLDLAETQMALRSCDDGDDAPRDDAADKALRCDLDRVHRLRVVLLGVALRAQARKEQRRPGEAPP